MTTGRINQVFSKTHRRGNHAYSLHFCISMSRISFHLLYHNLGKHSRECFIFQIRKLSNKAEHKKNKRTERMNTHSHFLLHAFSKASGQPFLNPSGMSSCTITFTVLFNSTVFLYSVRFHTQLSNTSCRGAIEGHCSSSCGAGVAS